MRAGVDRLERQRVVEVDVGDHRIGERSTIVRSATASSSRGTATRTRSAPASATLPICSIVASRFAVHGLGHRLHGDRRAAADRHAADEYLTLGRHGDIVTAGIALGLRMPSRSAITQSFRGRFISGAARALR